MIEDKLTHDERRRLECLAQAIHVAAHTSTPLAMASLLEAWPDDEPAQAT